MDMGRDSVCPKCGGTMIGDVYTTALHCEFVDLPEGIEADAPPTYCDYEEDAETVEFLRHCRPLSFLQPPPPEQLLLPL